MNNIEWLLNFKTVLQNCLVSSRIKITSTDNKTTQDKIFVWLRFGVMELELAMD